MPVNRGPMDSGTTGIAVRCTTGAPGPVPVVPGGCGRTTGTGRAAAGADPPEGDADAYGAEAPGEGGDAYGSAGAGCGAGDGGAGTRAGGDSTRSRAEGWTPGPDGTAGPPRAERCTSRRREPPIDAPRPARPVPVAARTLPPSGAGRAGPAEPPDGAPPGAPPDTER
ncbi:hypothetical protein ACFYXP_35915 [Streptomyces sp. NPDC002466]|uniref:hypothetical protein n=1 Tax=unclassified Streptomyces TaxID=2593676 RepID=UPI001652D18C|nr:hypothetical protein [Streptomyces sp. sk2.1]